MSDTTSGIAEVGAWFGARTGNAIDALVDREINRSARRDAATSFGVDENGMIYQRGVPGAQYAMPRQAPVSPLMVGVAVILLVLLLKD